MPKPKKDEAIGDYINRCMSDDKMQKKYPKQDQRFLVCQIIYKEEK